jgi:hypothetical protein
LSFAVPFIVLEDKGSSFALYTTISIAAAGDKV